MKKILKIEVVIDEADVRYNMKLQRSLPLKQKIFYLEQLEPFLAEIYKGLKEKARQAECKPESRKDSERLIPRSS